MEQDNMALGYAMGRDSNNGYGCGNGMWGGDWMAMWFILAILGFGNGGFGGGFGGGNNMLGYELGKTATQADVASGFNNSTVLNSLNDIKLGQQQAINYNNQGFSGLERVISDCCCQTQRAIDNVNFNNERNTCQIIQSQQMGTQRILDYLAQKENQDLRDKVLMYQFRESQSQQNAYLIDQIVPRARPAYAACNPNTGAFGFGGCNTGCGNCF
jgi:hypothetical protein